MNYLTEDSWLASLSCMCMCACVGVYVYDCGCFLCLFDGEKLYLRKNLFFMDFKRINLKILLGLVEVLSMGLTMNKCKTGVCTAFLLLILLSKSNIWKKYFVSQEYNYFLLSMQILSGNWKWAFRYYVIDYSL